MSKQQDFTKVHGWIFIDSEELIALRRYIARKEENYYMVRIAKFFYTERYSSARRMHATAKITPFKGAKHVIVVELGSYREGRTDQLRWHEVGQL